MSSTTRLLVLGVVRMFQPVHGYDVRRELVSWHAEEWANVAPGSIYNALKSLARDGLLEVEGTDQVGARPERTTYKITSRGEAEMMELLRETLWQVAMPVDPLVAALSLMWFVERKELISALEARTAKIKGNLEHSAHIIDAIDDVETPLHVRAMMSLLNARMGSELAWSDKFRAELAKGVYRAKGDPSWAPPGMEPGKLAKKSDVHTGPRATWAAKREAKRAAATAKKRASKPATSTPATSKPSTPKSAASKPATTKPATTTSAASKPATTKPATTKSAASKPATTTASKPAKRASKSKP